MAPFFRLLGRLKSTRSADAQRMTDSIKEVRWLIVGLGNPGRQYSGNRHNVGFHIVDRLARASSLQFDQRRNQAHLARGRIEGIQTALVKPRTYMNRSGEAVAGIARFYKVPPERILVIFDDLDLPLGTLRLRLKGGAGGHQGVTSIILRLNTQDFPRLRVGIGRPPGQMPPEAYVLQDFRPSERLIMEQAYQRAVEAIRVILRDGFEAAMNQFN